MKLQPRRCAGFPSVYTGPRAKCFAKPFITMSRMQAISVRKSVKDAFDFLTKSLLESRRGRPVKWIRSFARFAALAAPAGIEKPRAADDPSGHFRAGRCAYWPE